MNRNASPAPGRLRRAFSLIEIMIVLTVVGLLLAFAAPNIFSLLTATTLTGEGTLLRNQLTYAQQRATAMSADVEVRFFKIADASAAQTEEAFRALQLYQYNSTGQMLPISSFFRIREPVVVHEELSTLLQPRATTRREDRHAGFTSPRAGSGMAPIGRGGEPAPADYVSFRFRPDGSTDLPFRAGGMDTFYVTLVQGQGALQNNQPNNYVCLQVNPYNGQVTEFRP